MALRARYRCIDDEPLRLLWVHERLAVQLERPDLRMQKAFGGTVGPQDKAPVPQRGEFGALLIECVDEPRSTGLFAVVRVGTMEVRCHQTAQCSVVALGMYEPGGRVGEPAVVGATGQAHVGGLVAQERNRGPCLLEGLAKVVHHLGGGVFQVVQDAHYSWTDVVSVPHPARCGVAGDSKQMISLVQRQMQTSGCCGKHLFRRARTPRLFELDVVVD